MTFSSSKIKSVQVNNAIQRATEEHRPPQKAPYEPKPLLSASKLKTQEGQVVTSGSTKNYLVENSTGKCPQEMYDTYRRAEEQ